MKSQLPDQQIKTSCKNCLCAVYQDNTQIGCSFDRIQKFGENVIEAYDDEKEFYVIKRFCNYYRNIKWNDGILDLNKIKNESSISFDLFIDCNNLDNDIDTQELIRLLNNINYDINKIKIHLIHLASSDKTIRKNAFKVFCAIKCQITETIDIYEHIHNYIGSSRSTYHVILDMSNKSLISSLYKLNDIINDDIKQATLFNFETAKVISNIVYKIESSINDQVDYNTNITNIITKSLESNLCIDVL